MICAFCGSDNRAENKFCGICGVRLDQRKAERRVSNAGALKCDSCGHINEAGYKFCGMCGSRVERRRGERRGSGVEQPRAAAVANVQLPTPDLSPERRPERRSQQSRHEVETALPEEPPAFFKAEHDRSIHGPSFLGLNDSPETEGTYLLEEEEPTRRGLRTLVLLAVLAAIVGLIVVQWRSGFKASPKPPQTPQTEPAQAKPQGAKQDSLAPPPSPSSFADGGKQLLDQAFGRKDQQPSAASAATPGSVAANSTAGASADAAHSADASRSADPAPKDETAPASTVKSSAASGTESSANEPPESRRSSTAHAKPSPDEQDSSSQKPSAMLLKAQQYLQGSGGVRQNCEQGLIYLRAAAQKNEPAAAVQMGALYASGHCVQRDPVSAWRWFSSAREQEPSNQFIKANMDRLWAGMTEQERRQAGR